jgi:hypothetical protein
MTYTVIALRKVIVMVLIHQKPWIIDSLFLIFHNTFIRTVLHNSYLVNFCPECGGNLKFDPVSKDLVCESCGLFASREKLDEIRDKRRDQLKDGKKALHDDYLEWWQTSKKDKQSR